MLRRVFVHALITIDYEFTRSFDKEYLRKTGPRGISSLFSGDLKEETGAQNLKNDHHLGCLIGTVFQIPTIDAETIIYHFKGHQVSFSFCTFELYKIRFCCHPDLPKSFSLCNNWFHEA